MPDLESGIREWKRSLSLAFGDGEEILDELESHLREEIDRLMQAGQGPDAALAAAQAKLGRPVDIAAEYARVVPPARWLPIPAGLALFALLLGCFAWVAIVPLYQQRGDVLLILHVTAIVAGYAVGFYVGLLGLCYVACWLLRPISLGQRRALGRILLLGNGTAALLLLIGMVLGAGWAHDHLGHAWNNDPREIATLIPLLWFAVLAGLSRSFPRKQHEWALLSILAINVIVWGWFAPALLDTRLHSYGLRVTLLIVVIGGSTAPLAAAALGLLPPGRLRRQSA